MIMSEPSFWTTDRTYLKNWMDYANIKNVGDRNFDIVYEAIRRRLRGAKLIGFASGAVIGYFIWG